MGGGKVRYIMGDIEYSPEKQCFTVSGMIYRGKAGTPGERFYSEHTTATGAVAACEAVAAQYPDAETVNFIMDDISFPDGVTMP